MTNKTPSDPNSPEKNPLGFDEFIGILVAFVTIGIILFWSFSRKGDSSRNITELPPVLPTLSASPVVPIFPPTPSQKLAPPTTVNPTTTPFLEDNEAVSENELPPVSDALRQELPQKPPPLLLSPNTEIVEQLEQYSVVIPSERLPTIPPPIAFIDVPHDFWGRPFINKLSSRGIIKGFPDYSFRPNQPVTRAEFAAILQQAFNRKVSHTGIAFKDIPGQYWATPAIHEAISTGFLKGYPDKTFKPQQKISRVQVLVSLASGMTLRIPSSPEKLVSIYKDAKDIPEYAINKVATATANGLVVNYPDTQLFAPNKEATRAEVAAMVYQALVRMGRLQPIKSENIVTLTR